MFRFGLYSVIVSSAQQQSRGLRLHLLFTSGGREVFLGAGTDSFEMLSIAAVNIFVNKECFG